MKFIPLPDNEKNNINRMAEDIYGVISEVEKKVASLEGKTPEAAWIDVWVQASTDTDRLNVLAQYLGLIPPEV